MDQYEQSDLRCPSCGLVMAYFEKNFRYYCSRCGKAHLQRFTQDYNFRVWNLAQRKIRKDELNLNKKPRGKPKIFSEEELKEKRRIYALKRRFADLDKYLKRMKDYAQKNKQVVNYNQKLRYWSKKQDSLALEYFKNGRIKASAFNF